MAKANKKSNEAGNLKVKSNKNSLGIKKQPRAKSLKKQKKISNSINEKIIDEPLNQASEANSVDEENLSIDADGQDLQDVSTKPTAIENVNQANKDDEKKIRKLFAHCGEIENVQFILEKNLKKTDSVTFASFFEHERSNAGENVSKAKADTIFVGNLEHSDDLLTKLRNLFSQCGKLGPINIIKQDFDQNRCFAYVQFKDYDGFKAAFQLDGTVINEKPIFIKEKFTTFKELYTIFVVNLSRQTTKETLQEFFSKFGEIEAISLNSTTAFIKYFNSQSAKQAINHPDKIILDGRLIKVMEYQRKPGVFKKNKPIKGLIPFAYKGKQKPGVFKKNNPTEGLTAFEKKMLVQIVGKLNVNIGDNILK